MHITETLPCLRFQELRNIAHKQWLYNSVSIGNVLTRKKLEFFRGMVILQTEVRSTDDLFIPLQEKVDRTASSNPHLHLNRATVRLVEWWSSASQINNTPRRTIFCG